MRDYDPTIGRYIQADPLGLVDGASVYGYVRQNPNMYTDTRGEFLLTGAVGAGIGAVVGYADTGCWQGAVVGGAIGAAAGAGFVGLASIGANALSAGMARGAAASAVSQVLDNEINGICGCGGRKRPVKEVVFSSRFAMNTLMGAYGGSLGGFVGGSSSSLIVQLAKGSLSWEIATELAGGATAYVTANPVGTLKAVVPGG